MGMGKLAALAALGLALAVSAAMADVSEFANCSSIPQEVKFSREASPLGNVTKRREKYAGGDWIVMPHKNPEMAFDNGPLHARNCTPGSIGTGTQVLTFKMKTTNFFGQWYNFAGAAGGHIPVLMRGVVNRTNYTAGGTQYGRGLALFAYENPSAGGNVEFFNESNRLERMNIWDPYGYQIVWGDDVWFNYVIHVTAIGIAYWVRDMSRDVQVYQYHQGTVATNATYGVTPSGGWGLVTDRGYGFGVVCPDWKCEGATPQFEVHIKDITMSWFQP